MKKTVVASILGVASFAAHAIPDVVSVEARPNPARFAGTTPPQLNFVVTIRRGPLDMQRCEVMIDPGNPGGRQVPRLVFEATGAKTQTAHYVYDKPGSYRVTARGFNGCSGSRTITVAVQGADGKAPAAAAPAAATPNCPSGWTLVAGSAQGGRFTCSPKPPANPIKCPAGTSYFAENNLIGCR